MVQPNFLEVIYSAMAVNWQQLPAVCGNNGCQQIKVKVEGVPMPTLSP